ncbi:MAG: nucleotidyltransferase domain-containing protein [Rhodocyclaceae bacterium]|jgi:predicted nucleotidyltransferase|nr:nucleotidyltransferase domain-containing protein [Rhodocyclaceae bacterium]
MRLTPRQQHRLRSVIHDVFGPLAQARIFGSRLDDNRRGGDFDVLVETDLTDPAELVRRKLASLARLHASPEFEGERIDLVIASRIPGSEQPIHQVARVQGIPL